jgi:hypothetical protein
MVPANLMFHSPYHRSVATMNRNMLTAPPSNELHSSTTMGASTTTITPRKGNVTAHKGDVKKLKNVTVRKADVKNICICNWKDCKDLQAAIQKHAYEDHEWNGPLQCITMSDSPKSTALRASVQKHLQVDKIAAIRKIYYVAPHHWSRSLLAEKKKNGHRTTFLSQASAKFFDEADNHDRHAEDCTLVLVVLKKVKYELNHKQEMDFKNKFVQAPITSHEDVSAFVKTLSSTGSLEESMPKRQKLSPENSSQLQVRSNNANSALKKKNHTDPIRPHNDEDGTVTTTTTATVAAKVPAPVHVSSTGGMCPSLESFNKYFAKKYQELGCDIEAFRSYPYIRRDLKVVQFTYGRDNVVELGPSVYLVHCPGTGSSEDDCGLFVTRSKKPGNERRPACDACATVLRVQARRLSRKQASGQASSLEASGDQDKSSPSSKANIASLTAATIKAKLRNVVKKLRETEKKCKRLELKLAFSADDTIRDAVQGLLHLD